MSEHQNISATLKLDTALHIGAQKGGSPTDAELRRTGDGRLFVPGRAIGGALRTLATRMAPRLGITPCQALFASPNGDEPCGCPVCALFGDLHPVDVPKDSKVISRASRLWIYDAFAPAMTATYVRDGVGLDRKRGTASSQVKFDYEIIPAGTLFNLRLLLTEPDEQAAMLLVAALAEWQAGRGQLGGNTARGLGRFHLEDIRCAQPALEDNEQLIAFLASDDPWAASAPVAGWWPDNLAKAQTAAGDRHPAATADMPVLSGFVQVTFKLAFADLFLTNDPLVAALSGFDHAPAVEMVYAPKRDSSGRALGRPVLPGASLRGVLRARAERIARTLATTHWLAQDKEAAGATFRDRCPACDVLARHKDDLLASCDARLEIADSEETPPEALCLSCRLFGSQRRGSRLWVSDAPMIPPETKWLAQDFLAIDPFTGGGKHGAKFDAAALEGASFQAQIMLHDPQPWELGWLALLLRDLADGQLTVGFGAAKGYGSARASEWQWAAGFLSEENRAALNFGALETTRSGVYHLHQEEATAGKWLPAAWTEAAAGWTAAFNNEVIHFERGAEWQAVDYDSFFTADGLLLAQYGRSRTEVN